MLSHRPRHLRQSQQSSIAGVKVWAIKELREQIIDFVVALERPHGNMLLVRKRRYGSRPFTSDSSLQSVSRQTADDYQRSLWKYLQVHAKGLVFMVPDLDFSEILKFFHNMPPQVWTAIKARFSSHPVEGYLTISAQLEFSRALSKLVGKEEEMSQKLESLDKWAIFERRHELNVSLYTVSGLRPKHWEEMRSMTAFDTRVFEEQRSSAGPPYEIGYHAKEIIKCALDVAGEYNVEGPYWYLNWYQITSAHARVLSPWQQLGLLGTRLAGWRQRTGWNQNESRTRKLRRMIASCRIDGQRNRT